MFDESLSVERAFTKIISKQISMTNFKTMGTKENALTILQQNTRTKKYKCILKYKLFIKHSIKLYFNAIKYKS